MSKGQLHSWLLSIPEDSKHAPIHQYPAMELDPLMPMDPERGDYQTIVSIHASLLILYHMPLVIQRLKCS